MKFLMVLPKVVTNINQYYLFPVGLAYVSAALKQCGYSVDTVNLNIYEQSTYEVLENIIIENEIDVICTGGLTSQYNAIKEIIDNAKIIKKSIISVVGGGYITSDPHSAMKCIPNIDIGVIGEGEITICELADALESNKSLHDVKGLIFKNQNEFIITKGREDIKDLNSLPFPDYEGFNIGDLLEKKSNMFGYHGDGDLTIVTSRSCPYNCTFCFHPSGQSYRVRSLDNIFEEIDYFVTRYNIKCINFIDELFALKEERVQEFCKRIKKYNISWRTSVRVNLASRKILKMMKESGCILLTYGIESGDDRILKSMKKGITTAQIEEALNNAYLEDIAVSGSFIFGDIEETMETSENSINLYKKYIQHNISLTMIIVFPGSYLYEYACEHGIIKDRIEYIKQGCPLINVSKLTDEQYSNLAIRLAELNDCQEIIPSKWEILNIDYENCTVDIKANCFKCNEENIWSSLPIVGQLRRPICLHCSQVHSNFYAALYYKNAVANLINLAGDKKIAIWGLARHITNIFKNFEEIRKIGITLIDSSIAKQGNVFYDNIVCAPTALFEKNIEVLINSVPDERYSEIKKEIGLMDLPNLKYYATLGDILNPDFNIENFVYKKGNSL